MAASRAVLAALLLVAVVASKGANAHGHAEKFSLQASGTTAWQVTLVRDSQQLPLGDNPVLFLTKGETYTFEITDPLAFRETPDGSDIAVDSTDTSTNTIVWTVPTSSSSLLYYVSPDNQASGMFGTIFVQTEAREDSTFELGPDASSGSLKWTVKANEADVELGLNPTLYVHEEEMYTFVLTAPFSSHPLELRDSPGGQALTNGVTVNAQNVTWMVPAGLTSVYYECTLHSSMSGMIVVRPSDHEQATLCDVDAVDMDHATTASTGKVDVDAMVQFDCDQGYHVDGNMGASITLTCTEHGNFSTTNAMCVRTSCGEPPASFVTNAAAPNITGPVWANTSITYKCNAGHHVPATLKHEVSVRCGFDGNYQAPSSGCSDIDACSLGAICPFGAVCKDQKAPLEGYDCECPEDLHESFNDEGSLVGCLSVQLDTDQANLHMKAADVKFDLFDTKSALSVEGSLLGIHHRLSDVVNTVASGVQFSDLSSLEQRLSNSIDDLNTKVDNGVQQSHLDDLESALEAYADQAASDAAGDSLTQAKAYTDQKITMAKDAAAQYTDESTQAAKDDLLKAFGTFLSPQLYPAAFACMLEGKAYNPATRDCAKRTAWQTPEEQFAGTAPDEHFTNYGLYTSFENLYDKKPFTLWTKVWFKPKTTNSYEVIFETGGTVTGFAVYRNQDNLVVGACKDSEIETLVVNIPPYLISEEELFVDLIISKNLATATTPRSDRYMTVILDSVVDGRHHWFGDISGADGASFGKGTSSACSLDNNDPRVDFDQSAATVQVDLSVGLKFWSDNLYVPTMAAEFDSDLAKSPFKSCQDAFNAGFFRGLHPGHVYTVPVRTSFTIEHQVCRLLSADEPGAVPVSLRTLPSIENDGLTPQTAAVSCAALHKMGDSSGVRYIQDFQGTGSFQVYCDQESHGGGWTLCAKAHFPTGTADNDRHVQQGFGRAAVNAGDMKDTSTFTSTWASVDCRGFLRGAELLMHVGDANGQRDAGWDLVRFTALTDDVWSDPTNFWDVSKDVDDQPEVAGVCTPWKVQTYKDPLYAGRLLTDDQLDALSKKGLMYGTGTYFARTKRSGATFSNAAFETCQGSGDDTVYWAWDDTGNDDHGCTRNGVVVGTGCKIAPPTHPFNYVFVR